ncbi:hypothetical protein RchiOBHm_Chr1g0333391 [Rosa chinensis]|uniref:Uncharacterized protein n=1 Tax=Rosa chinensis TaxID=74649 RepID=A0A2P6SC41_ROSCH|nr:hypothetical protein RchiOBHm_Chr1g0333391 [Rosa chinensis]
MGESEKHSFNLVILEKTPSRIVQKHSLFISTYGSRRIIFFKFLLSQPLWKRFARED